MRELLTLLNADALAQLADAALHAPAGGCLVQIGVYKGGAAQRALYPVAISRALPLHLFDTFAGHPAAPSACDHATAHPAGRFGDVTLADLAALCAAMPDAVVHVGDVGTLTMPTEVAARGISLAHIDVDTYAATRAAVAACAPHMHPSAVWVFDDYGHDDCPGATAAVDEVFGPQPGRLPGAVRRILAHPSILSA